MGIEGREVRGKGWIKNKRKGNEGNRWKSEGRVKKRLRERRGKEGKESERR